MPCPTCNGAGGAGGFHLRLNAVAVQGYRQRRPTHMDVFYVPDQQAAPPAHEDIVEQQLPENLPRRRRHANNGNGSGIHPVTQTLNLGNISRVARGDRVELKSNGIWTRYEVIDHAIIERTIEMFPEGSEPGNGRPFNYEQLIQREARFIIRFQRDRDLWEQRIEVPQDFPRKDLSAITLNLGNISRVARGDRVELKFNGTWTRYEVQHHAIMQRTIEMSPEGPEPHIGRRRFNYAQLIEREARIVFRNQRDFDLWEERIEVPQDFPRKDLSAITLNLGNISRVARGDEVELKSDGTWTRYDVINHAIMQRMIEMSLEGPKSDNG